MTTVKDIAKILANRHQLSNAEADIFMQMIVEVINDGLLKDRIVKIKGFGTFKLQAVKERISVNVNTGERVVIAEHDKVSFVPDNVMKDLINKPFAQFETVIVNNDSLLLDGETETDIYPDTDDETIPANGITDALASTASPTPAPAAEETAEEKDSIQEAEAEEPIVKQEVKEHREMPVSQKTQQPQPDNAHEEIDDEEEEEECDHPFPRCRNIFIYYGVIINVVVAVIAFILGFYAGSQKWFCNDEAPQNVAVPQSTKQVKPQTANSPRKRDIVKETSLTATKEAKDTISLREKSPAQEAKQKEDIQAKPVETGNAKAEQPLRQYDSDVRVRTGAYYIMGTDREVVVKKGQTLQSISRAYLGEGMECYIEAYNNTKTVKEGDTIRIPKLKLKKKSK